MTRRSFLAAATAASGLGSTQASRRPNIILIFSDDHAYQAISAYGSRLIPTPNIDRLGREGVRFDQALVTNSICAPSRAVVLTGKYSHLNCVLDNRQAFDGSQTTFPKLLQAAGYQTALFGKWHLKSGPTGFDTWEILPGQGHYYNPDFLSPSGSRRREGYVTELITRLSLDWLENGRDQTRPFLLLCQHKAPHRNWMPAPSKLHLFADTAFPEPPNLFDDYTNRASPVRHQTMEIDRHMTLAGDLKIVAGDGRAEPGEGYANFAAEYGRMTETQKRIWNAAYGPRNQAFRVLAPQGQDLVRYKYQRYLQDYLRCIASVDDSVGELLNWLDASGEASNTLVVYASDQGFYLGEHGWFDKRWIYEESVRTPLLVRFPGRAREGLAVKEMAANLDLAPTFLETAGLPTDPEMQGRSLLPLLEGRHPPDWRRSFYYRYYEKGEHGVAPHEGVRTSRYTLVHFPESGEWELYDREKDPQQMRSCYADPAYAKTARELTAELRRLRTELRVP